MSRPSKTRQKPAARKPAARTPDTAASRHPETETEAPPERSGGSLTVAGLAAWGAAAALSVPVVAPGSLPTGVEGFMTQLLAAGVTPGLLLVSGAAFAAVSMLSRDARRRGAGVERAMGVVPQAVRALEDSAVRAQRLEVAVEQSRESLAQTLAAGSQSVDGRVAAIESALGDLRARLDTLLSVTPQEDDGSPSHGDDALWRLAASIDRMGEKVEKRLLKELGESEQRLRGELDQLPELLERLASPPPTAIAAAAGTPAPAPQPDAPYHTDAPMHEASMHAAPRHDAPTHETPRHEAPALHAAPDPEPQDDDATTFEFADDLAQELGATAPSGRDLYADVPPMPRREPEPEPRAATPADRPEWNEGAHGGETIDLGAAPGPAPMRQEPNAPFPAAPPHASRAPEAAAAPQPPTGSPQGVDQPHGLHTPAPHPREDRVGAPQTRTQGDGGPRLELRGD